MHSNYINMYFLIETRHDFLIQYHWNCIELNCIEVENFICMHEIEKISLKTEKLYVLRGDS